MSKEIQALGSAIPQLEGAQIYEYLGMQLHLKITKIQMFNQMEAEFKRRIKLVLKTSLSAKSCIKTYNTWAIPSPTYNFGVLK